MKSPDNRPSPFENRSAFNLNPGEDSKLEYSMDGSLLLHTHLASASVLDAASAEQLLVIKGPADDMVQGAALSPKGTYLITCSRWSPGRKEKSKVWTHETQTGSSTTEVEGNLQVWHVKTGELIADWEASWPFDPNHWPYLQWAPDESLMARYRESCYELHDLGMGATPWLPMHTVPMSGNGVLKLAPQTMAARKAGERPSVFMALFTDEGEEEQSLSLLAFPNRLDTNDPIRKTPVSNTEEVAIRWAYDGSAFLALCTAHIDETNANYYGTTTLYFVSTLDVDNHIVNLDKDGPVHDFSWSPCTREFIVIYGVMPAKACLFNHLGTPVFSYGSASVNTISWAPHGRFVCLGGFGNLAGTMIFWDKVLQKKLGEATARCAIYKAFSPCSRYFLTAVTFPSLRVDNEISLWRYDGELIYREQHIPELYQCQWRPSLPSLWPDRSASPDVLERMEKMRLNGIGGGAGGPRTVQNDGSEKTFVPFRRATFSLHDNIETETAGVVDSSEWPNRPRHVASESATVGAQVEGRPFGVTVPELSKSQLKRMKRKAKEHAKKEREAAAAAEGGGAIPVFKQ